MHGLRSNLLFLTEQSFDSAVPGPSVFLPRCATQTAFLGHRGGHALERWYLSRFPPPGSPPSRPSFNNMLSRMTLHAIAALAAVVSLCCGGSRCSVSAFAFTAPLRSASASAGQRASGASPSWDRRVQLQRRQLRCGRELSPVVSMMAEKSHLLAWCMIIGGFQCHRNLQSHLQLLHAAGHQLQYHVCACWSSGGGRPSSPAREGRASDSLVTNA